MRAPVAILAVAAAAAFAPTFASADWDFQENLFGATNVNAQAGNGGLTAGFASTGELTVLGWPSPSYYDQLDYQTSSDADAREQPYFGADPAEGVFEDQRFMHPDLDLTLVFPGGWQTVNTRRAVGALSKKGDLQILLQHQGPGNDPREASAAFFQEASEQVGM